MRRSRPCIFSRCFPNNIAIAPSIRLASRASRVIAVLDKMVKQRRDSAEQYQNADRQELADQELLEIRVIQEFLPSQLSEAELIELVDAALAATDASGMQAMGAVMGQLKPQLQGRADMGAVSQLVKARLLG